MAFKDTWGKVKKRPDPLTSIALTIPVFLIYHLGILVVESRTGVDLVSNTVFGVLKASAPVYVVVTLALALVVATVTWIEERRGVSSSVPLSKVVVEGFGFAVVLVGLAWAASLVLHTPEPAGARDLGVVDKLVLAAGTGFHEEFIFRAVLVSGLGWVLGKIFRMSTKGALGVAIALSSIAYAVVINVGPGGEPFVGDIALFRLALGVFFAALYIGRGFAVAVYAHVLFEVLRYFVFT
jgi:membrane protease YdiL (CAAX protease family)